MKIKFERNYRKGGTGRVVFVYKVSGSTTELVSYEKAQGDNLRKDKDGSLLFFSTNFAGDDANLIITSAGKAVVDMSEFEKMSSLIEQYDGKFAEALANQAVKDLLGNNASTQSATEATKPIQVEDGTSDLEDL
jgi:hypothetical protein